MTIGVKFIGADASAYASKAYRIHELDQLTSLVTDASGIATFQVPVTLDTATVIFSDTGESFALVVGGMDPCDTPSGVFKRLQNLGYLAADADLASADATTLQAALLAFQAAHGPPASQPPDSNTGPDSDTLNGWSTARPTFDSPPSDSNAAQSTEPPPSSPDASGSSTAAGQPAAGPDRVPPTDPPANPPSPATDDGAPPSNAPPIDDAARQLLLQVHGS